MSYFSTEKRINLAAIGIYTSGTNSVGSSAYVDLQTFSADTQVQLASSIGYPTVTTNSITIDLEVGWKYLIEFRMKVSDASPTTSENVQYRIVDTSDTVLSSIGSCSILRDNLFQYAQEKCIAYIDATTTAKTFKTQAIKIGGGTINVNSSADAGNTNFRMHLFIKAWR
jgi:hypothetical protein